MEEARHLFLHSNIPRSAFSTSRPHLDVHRKKRGQGSRSWIKIDQNGNTTILHLDKATIMRNCSLPARDLRLLDPMFIYPSTILGREKAIVVSLEQIRCIITAEEVILMNSLDGCVVQYKSELCKRLKTNRDQEGRDIDFSIVNITENSFLKILWVHFFLYSFPKCYSYKYLLM